MNQALTRASTAVLAGSIVIFLGDILLGVQIEIFSGISTFTIPWTLDVFLVPYISGVVVAVLYKERAGKWLAFLPPIIVRCLNCLYLYLTNEDWNADFFYHLHLHYWGLCVILAAEAANLGGCFGTTRSGAYLRNDDDVGNTVDRKSGGNEA